MKKLCLYLLVRLLWIPFIAVSFLFSIFAVAIDRLIVEFKRQDLL
jgi:hypothetical protein